MCNALFSIMDLKVIEASAGEVRPDDPLRDHVERYSKLQFIAGDVARTLLAPTYLCRAGYDRIADTVRAPVERGLGRTLSFLPGKSTFRRQSSAQRPAYVGWHRDAQAASSEGYLVCWVPLQSVGKARPSLQIVVGSNRTPARYVEHDDRMDDMIRERYGEENVCTAVLEPGDFMIFDHHILRRNQPIDGIYPTRVSGELQFAVMT
jgi:hypothetical protein